MIYSISLSEIAQVAQGFDTELQPRWYETGCWHAVVATLRGIGRGCFCC